MGNTSETMTLSLSGKKDEIFIFEDDEGKEHRLKADDKWKAEIASSIGNKIKVKIYKRRIIEVEK